jgi:hypothetical protein
MRKCKLNENAFDEVTESSAYWIGFLMADGCINLKKNRQPSVSLRISERDIEHVEKFRSFLESTHKISVYENKRYNTNGKLASIAVTSSKLVLDLEKYGVTARKSLTAKACEELEQNPNFWRGMVDGDGYIYTTFNNLPAIGLCGSENIVKQFENFVKQAAPNCQATPRHRKIWQFQTSGKHAYLILKELYQNTSVSLDRKQTLANDILSVPWTSKKADRSNLTHKQLLVLKESLGTWKNVAQSLNMNEKWLSKLVWRRKHNKH